MASKQHLRPLRLGIAVEARALMSDLGVDAYWVARQRAQEASSDAMATDWTGVAMAIARSTRRRTPSLIAAMLH